MTRRYGKRQRFGDRYVARNARGEFISNVDVGRSLKQDRARKAKDQNEQSGFGQMGDERRAEFAAQGYNAKLDESLGMSRKQSMMRQSRKARRDESKGTEKYDGSRAYSRVGTMDKSAEGNLAVADVEVWDGMVLPEGTGSIIGQAVPETDFTPFGVSAEGYDDKLDESLGMSHKESKMKQSLKARRDESKGMKKASGKRAYSRVGTMDKNADYFENAVGGFYPTGDGRAFGSMTLDNTYAPLAAAEGDITSGFKMGMGATLGVIGGLAFAGWVGGMMSSLSAKKDE
mgnify:FL=1|tara:strand:- start:2671 stop:3531 length:861 start_codon:yes stop_codon:yes gene_type:complete